MSKKSTRNVKNGRISEPSAGDKELISSHCPPDMTEAVKSALEQEIEAFKLDHRTQAEVRREAQRSAAGGPNADAYETWVAKHGGEEVPEANPDVIADEDGLKYIETRKDGKLASLLLEFRESLTPRQLQVWNLTMKHCMSVSEAAKLLGLARTSVQDYLYQAKKKFTKFGEAIRDARQD